jgi:hypothetical protein
MHRRWLCAGPPFWMSTGRSRRSSA